MEQWFSSDPHFGHENIIKFCNRPFKDAVEMTEEIVARHNKLVKPEDHWTCLGDVTMDRKPEQAEGFIKIVKRMNGHKRLILGNHDHFPIKTYMEAGFEKIYAMHLIDRIRLSHIAIHPLSMGDSIGNVHGHIHNNPTIFHPVLQLMPKSKTVLVKPYVNISMELTNYEPVTLGWLKSKIAKEADAYEQ